MMFKMLTTGTINCLELRLLVFLLNSALSRSVSRLDLQGWEVDRTIIDSLEVCTCNNFTFNLVSELEMYKIMSFERKVGVAEVRLFSFFHFLKDLIFDKCTIYL